MNLGRGYPCYLLEKKKLASPPAALPRPLLVADTDDGDGLVCFLPVQFALRLLAFRQIHKVLGMDPLPQMNPRFNVRNSRKRRRDNSDGNDSFEGEGKKDKKDHEGF